MPRTCNCGSNRATATANKVWTHIAPDGKRTSYDRESDARMALSRLGGRIT